MRVTFLFVLLVLIGAVAYAQPQKGDYLMTATPGEEFGHYVYKNSRKVFYEYYFDKKKSNNVFKKAPEQMEELFKLADALDWNGAKRYDEKEAAAAIKAADEASVAAPYYYIFEYRKGDKVYRVCVLLDDSQDAQTAEFQKLAVALEGLW